MNTRKIEAIAQICHEVNKAYCELNLDFSQLSWNDTTKEIRESAISGVIYVLKHRSSVTFSALHDNWMAEKIDKGWVYGEVKDPVKKTHPCIVPFEQLTRYQQYKDELFIRTVLTYADLLKD